MCPKSVAKKCVKKVFQAQKNKTTEKNTQKLPRFKKKVATTTTSSLLRFKKKKLEIVSKHKKGVDLQKFLNPRGGVTHCVYSNTFIFEAL